VNNYHHDDGARYLLNYHFVWKPLRKDLFRQNSSIQTVLRQTIRKLARRHQFKILKLTIKPRYFHLLLGARPSYAPSRIMNIIKGATGRQLAQKFPEFKVKNSIWKPQYIVSSESDLNPTIF